LACPGGQCDGELAADGAESGTDAVGIAAGDDAAGNDVAGNDAAGDDAAGAGVAEDADGTAVGRDRGGCVGCVGVVPAVPAVPAGRPGATPAAAPWPPAVPWPDSSSATATAVTMTMRAAAQPARAVRKLVSSSRELMASRSLARPAGRA